MKEWFHLGQGNNVGGLSKGNYVVHTLDPYVIAIVQMDNIREWMHIMRISCFK